MTISAEEIAKALVILARLNVPVDIQELLVIGNPDQGISPGALAKVIATVVADMTAQIEKSKHVIRECASALGNGAFVSPECSDEFHAQVPTEIAKCVSALRARIAALEAELAERDARISVLEVAAVKAVLPLEAMNISGVAKRFDEETTLAILDGISSVRAAIRARSEQEGR